MCKLKTALEVVNGERLNPEMTKRLLFAVASDIDAISEKLDLIVTKLSPNEETARKAIAYDENHKVLASIGKFFKSKLTWAIIFGIIALFIDDSKTFIVEFLSKLITF
ncbi:hypothetical protein AGMMS49965_09770 [Bacteroidia bacterium]|nr:hypothetical protein AGMMS49965_09770 [Bacteroidia bacterium]